MASQWGLGVSGGFGNGVDVGKYCECCKCVITEFKDEWCC